MNLFGLILFLGIYAGLLVKYKFNIDKAAIIICSLYPLGNMAQVIWRIWGYEINDIIRSFIIVLHDLVVVSPSYFVYEMLKVQVVIGSSGIDDFKRSDSYLRAWGLAISVILCATTVIGAFCTSFGITYIYQSEPNEIGKPIFIVGSVFFMIFFITATIPYVFFIKSLSYFMKRKI